MNTPQFAPKSQKTSLAQLVSKNLQDSYEQHYRAFNSKTKEVSFIIDQATESILHRSILESLDKSETGSSEGTPRSEVGINISRTVVVGADSKPLLSNTKDKLFRGRLTIADCEPKRSLFVTFRGKIPPIEGKPADELPRSVFPFDILTCSEELRKGLNASTESTLPSGLLLITGRTASGKTTLIAGLLHRLILMSRAHTLDQAAPNISALTFVTLEDPDELLDELVAFDLNENLRPNPDDYRLGEPPPRSESLQRSLGLRVDRATTNELTFKNPSNVMFASTDLTDVPTIARSLGAKSANRIAGAVRSKLREETIELLDDCVAKNSGYECLSAKLLEEFNKLIAGTLIFSETPSTEETLGSGAGSSPEPTLLDDDLRRTNRRLLEKACPGALQTLPQCPTLVKPCVRILPEEPEARRAYFKMGLQTALRQTPDVVFIGELRDSYAWHAAFRFALTGHLVIATAHAGSVAESLLQLFDHLGAKSASDRAFVAQSMLGVIHQKVYRGLPRSAEGELQYEPFIPSAWWRSAPAVKQLATIGLSAFVPRQKANTGFSPRSHFVQCLERRTMSIYPHLRQVAELNRRPTWTPQDIRRVFGALRRRVREEEILSYE